MSKILIDEATVKLVLDAFSVIEISDNLDWIRHQAEQQAAALREALAEPDFWEGYVPEPDKRQQALDKKAENARELGLDYEPAQQEPVAWMTKTRSVWKTKADETDTPLYTSPQPAQRTWVGLTDEERFAIADEYQSSAAAALMVEAKLREKNYGN